MLHKLVSVNCISPRMLLVGLRADTLKATDADAAALSLTFLCNHTARCTCLCVSFLHLNLKCDRTFKTNVAWWIRTQGHCQKRTHHSVGNTPTLLLLLACAGCESRAVRFDRRARSSLRSPHHGLAIYSHVEQSPTETTTNATIPHNRVVSPSNLTKWKLCGACAKNTKNKTK